METLVTTNWRTLLERAQNGGRAEVASLVMSDSSPEGCLLNGYLIFESRPEKAKEMFAIAKLSNDPDVVCQASIYEARSYEFLGQPDEGKVLIRLLLEQDLKPEFRAQALLVLAVFQISTPKRALTTLEMISLDGLPAGLKARIFILRAKIKSHMNDHGAALIEYAGAAAYFEEDGDTHGIAHVLNNRAAVELRLKMYVEAHNSVDNAISLVPRTFPFLPQFLDLKAQIFLGQQRYIEAQRVAARSVALARAVDRKDVLCENLCTIGLAHAALKDYPRASAAFSEAKDLAEGLDSRDLLFKVASARRNAAQIVVRHAEVEMAELALSLCDGSYRSAAKKIGLTHTGIIKLLARNSRQWKPKKPQSLIRKPFK